MHHNHPLPPRLRPFSLPAILLLGALCAPGPARAHDESHLEAPPGFHAHNTLRYDQSRFIGGLLALPGGGLVVYDGSSVVLHAPDGSSPRVLFTPSEPPVFGSFLRLAPDGASIYFGETHAGESPHRIYRIPAAGVGVEKVEDSIRFNFDLAFDDRGRGFVSSLEIGSENRIFLLDHDPDKPSDAVVVGIPGFSGPLVFHGGRLYYATALPEAGANKVVYFTSAQLEAGIGEGKEFDFNRDLPADQVVVSGVNSYFNLVFIGDRLFASDTFQGRINRFLFEGPEVKIEAFASVPLPTGASGAVTFLTFRPGLKEFRAGAGPEGGSLFLSISDFSTFNDLVEVTPELFFRRGYISPGPEVDLSDGIALLEYLFRGGPPPDPRIAGDLNDDRDLDVSDAIYLLAYLFTGGPQPPEPFVTEGPDPTP